jgi:hypothetical protein
VITKRVTWVGKSFMNPTKHNQSIEETMGDDKQILIIMMDLNRNNMLWHMVTAVWILPSFSLLVVLIP